MSASKIQRRSVFKSWDPENLIQVLRAVFKKEMGYLAPAKNITCLVLHYTITFAQIGTLFKPPSQNWGVSQLITPLALEEKLVEYLLVTERKYFGCTRDDVRRLAF
jgi:hypothetical protein